MASILCLNKGCGNEFVPDNNHEAACTYHPGVPVFHDALKGWSCCETRRRDFSDFLNIRGCTKGFHSNVKPTETEVKLQNNQEEILAPVVLVNDTETFDFESHKPPVILERPSASEELKELHIAIHPSLTKAQQPSNNGVLKNLPNDQCAVKIGTTCKNRSCNSKFSDSNKDETICKYHSGEPIFHEGLKFWTCCQIKTCDFDNFLKQNLGQLIAIGTYSCRQVGCVAGQHKWVEDVETTSTSKPACRFDWHESGDMLVLAIYAKKIVPEKTWVKINQVTLEWMITCESGVKEFSKSIHLNGVIDINACKAEADVVKLEITLKKAELRAWKFLEYADGAESPACPE